MSGYKGGVHELPFTAVCPEFRIVDVIPVIGITGYEVDMEAEMAVLPAVQAVTSIFIRIPELFFQTHAVCIAPATGHKAVPFLS